MQLNLLYLPHEDRMRFSLRGKVDWVITRSLVLRLVALWIQQLQKIDLPNAGIALGQRDVRQEHALSLEFDGPQASGKSPSASTQTQLLQEIDLTVDAYGTRLTMKGEGVKMTLGLTRKESHMVLEMLANKARQAKWLEPAPWPDWLGCDSGMATNTEN